MPMLVVGDGMALLRRSIVLLQAPDVIDAVLSFVATAA